MFQIEWVDKKKWHSSGIESLKTATNLKAAEVKRVLFLKWEEHCVECAVPECYGVCPLYERRSDGACRRFAYGIYPNPDFKGLYNFGADICFKRWSKIEADLNCFSFPAPVYSHNFMKYCDWLPLRLKRKISVVIKKKYTKKKIDFDNFVLECFSPHKNSFNLILEYFTQINGAERKTKFRHVFDISHGRNFYTVPFSDFNIDNFEGLLFLHPEESDTEKRLIFTWLDFVKYSKTHAEPAREPTEKTKCVAWDLDNTLWEGILAESTQLKPVDDALKLIKQLDERGILQTIVSKNDHESAWEMLERFGIEDYFLYPAINWGQKSQNLKSIAKSLNIGLDTFAVIDDSAFEREEIKQSLPEVRVYSEKQIKDIIELPSFSVEVTDVSKKRRSMYISEMKRKKLVESFSGDYEDFLISCQMQMEIFRPKKEKHITRCWELVQRSNQLNISSRRYTTKEFEDLLNNKEWIGIAFSCNDKFGDYGIVGFATVSFASEKPVLEDLVISCRVAQKKVEHTFVDWLNRYISKLGHDTLYVRLVKTKKNRPIRQVFSDFEFQKTKEESEHVILLQRECASVNILQRKIIDLTVKDFN